MEKNMERGNTTMKIIVYMRDNGVMGYRRDKVLYVRGLMKFEGNGRMVKDCSDV